MGISRGDPYYQQFTLCRFVMKEHRKFLEGHRGNPGEVQVKADGTPCTPIDKHMSREICKELEDFDYAILDEEEHSHMMDEHKKLSKKKGDALLRNYWEPIQKSEYVWIVDALDNTAGFIDNSINYAVLIGLCKRNDDGLLHPVLGCVDVPAKGQFYWAATDSGAHCEDTRHEYQLEVNGSHLPAMLVTANKDYARGKNPEFDTLIDRLAGPDYTPHTMGGMLKMIEVARGERLNMFLHPPEKPLYIWDLCATSIILEEAGGQVTDFWGRPINYSTTNPHHTTGVLATNGTNHHKYVRRICPDGAGAVEDSAEMPIDFTSSEDLANPS